MIVVVWYEKYIIDKRKKRNETNITYQGSRHWRPVQNGLLYASNSNVKHPTI